MVTVAFKFVPQTTATTFAFSSVFILLLWLYRPPCTQLRTDLRYSLPQFLRAQYLPKVRQQESNVYAYILYLPSTVKVSSTSPSYGFISYIAEVAGWYNLFLGGSVLAPWEGLWSWAFAKMDLKLGRLNRLLTWLYWAVATCILVYILVDSTTTLVDNPIGTSTMLRPSLTGLSLSICWPQYTSVFTRNATTKNYGFKDVANTPEFWMRGIEEEG